MRVEIDYRVLSGEWKGRLVTQQVAQAIGRAVAQIGLHTDGRDAELLRFIEEITFRCHNGSGIAVDVEALILIALPQSQNVSDRTYQCISQTAMYRFGHGAPVEDFGERILDAVAKAIEYKRAEK